MCVCVCGCRQAFSPYFQFASMQSCVKDTQFCFRDRINADWVIQARGSNVARPESPCEPKGNIADDPSRYIDIYIYIYVCVCVCVCVSTLFHEQDATQGQFFKQSLKVQNSMFSFSQICIHNKIPFYPTNYSQLGGLLLGLIPSQEYKPDKGYLEHDTILRLELSVVWSILCIAITHRTSLT